MGRLHLTNNLVYVALATAVAALLIGFGALAYSVVTNANRIADINTSRFDNTVTACDLRNLQNHGVHVFIESFPGPPSRAVNRAIDHAWPLTRDCKAYARAKVKP